VDDHAPVAALAAPLSPTPLVARRGLTQSGVPQGAPIRGFDRVGFTTEVKPMSRRPMPNALDLDLRGGLTDAVTPHAGVTLLIDLGRRSGVIPAADRHLPAKQSAKGLGHRQFVEAFVLLSALAASVSTISSRCGGTGAWRHWSAMTCRRRPPRDSGSRASMT